MGSDSKRIAYLLLSHEQLGSRCHRKKLLKDVRFAINLSKTVRFALNAMKAEKKFKY